LVPANQALNGYIMLHTVANILIHQQT